MKPQIGLTFASALRSFLRQDPDIMMIGEIRDLETAQIAVQAALTGHLVLSTVHTNDAASAITRLLDMGIEDYLLTSTINGVLAQRLVRRLCPACREPLMRRRPTWRPGFGLAARGDGRPIVLHRPRRLRRLQRHRLSRAHDDPRADGDARSDPRARAAPCRGARDPGRGDRGRHADHVRARAAQGAGWR